MVNGKCLVKVCLVCAYVVLTNYKKKTKKKLAKVFSKTFAKRMLRDLKRKLEVRIFQHFERIFEDLTFEFKDSVHSALGKIESFFGEREREN